MLISYVAIAPETLEKALTVVRLIEERPQDGPTLAGCATVMLAAALDQGTKGILDYRIRCAPHDDDYDEKALERLRASTLFDRVLSLPELMSGYTLILYRQHPHVRTLKELITWRNRLAHPSNSINSELMIPLACDGGSVTFDALEIPSLRDDQNPWEAVTPESARRFAAAVQQYFDEVLNRVNESLQPSGMLATRTKH